MDVGLGYLTLDRQSRTLSGGEVQRVSLTTALGTNLTDTLFVLDEPSIGLHPRDMDRINAILENLKKAGNTLVVVEHDPQVMLAADRIIDMGPGAGSAGGTIVFDGTPQSIRASKTETGLYLSGKKSCDGFKHKAFDRKKDPKLTVVKAHGHNLKNKPHHDGNRRFRGRQIHARDRHHREQPAARLRHRHHLCRTRR